ncbi:MAG TPA: cation-translocating P-type ATPase, partial [Propionibacterium sp.]|nr:cation-translocating P-type ATPase [Propionibacterium sp.]
MNERIRRWAIPAVSGTLIVVALIVGQFNPTVGDWFMLAAAIVAGTPVVRKAISALRVKVIGIDLLVSVAAIGAIFIRNFWEAAAVTFLFALGAALENATLAKTRSALAELVALAPTTAIVVRDGEQVEVPAHTVGVGETVIVKNGGRVPVDATVTSGQAAVDEAAITGESIPAEKSEGSEVFAGTIVADGFLTLSATGVGADTTLARIVHRVEEAQDAKARTQQFMERFSKWYTPGIIALALVVGLITRDLELALTLLVIGCPGALVISVPVALVAGIGRAARDGILIKGGEFLETAAKVDVVALDKTGTITRGEPRLVRTLSTSPGDEHDVLRWAALAEAGSEHPLAIPVLAAAREAGIGVPAIPDSVRSVPGHGVVAQVEGRTVAVGNLALIHQVEADRGADWAESAVEELSSAGQTPLLVAV